MSEKQKLQDPVKEYILSLGLKEPIHIENNQYRQKYRKSASKYLTGFPDHLIIMPNGICLFFEYKDGTKLSKYQIEWRDYLTKLGHAHHLITSLDEAKTIINYWIKKPSLTGKNK